MRALPENLLVGLEAHAGAAAVRRFADRLEPADRVAALENLAVKHLPARDLHLQPLGQRIDDRYADAMQAARCLVGARVELTARVQRGHDDLERGFLRKLRMRVD